jgi:hypothetical protein
MLGWVGIIELQRFSVAFKATQRALYADKLAASDVPFAIDERNVAEHQDCEFMRAGAIARR